MGVRAPCQAVPVEFALIHAARDVFEGTVGRREYGVRSSSNAVMCREDGHDPLMSLECAYCETNGVNR